jgi:membrane associated rhomboid family serine protease
VFILPIAKTNEVRRIPGAVITLIAANCVVFIFTVFAPSQTILFQQHGFTAAHPTFATLFSSMFLHAGFWHIAGNMWFLWMFGNRVENTVGHVLFIPLYLLCGIAGAGLHWMSDPHSVIPCVGASGAISGIVGIFFILFPKADFDLCIFLGWWRIKEFPTKTTAAVGAWILEQTVLGLLTQATHFSSTAFWAHIGGFALGAVIGLVYAKIVPPKIRLSADRMEPWYMQERFNRERESELTQLKL